MNRREAFVSCVTTGMLINSAFTKLSYAQGQNYDGSSECMKLPALFDQVFSNGKGFDSGKVSEKSAPNFVFFDPQCPDCIKFWNISNHFKTRAHFIWLPVAVLNSRSEPQGALILSAPDPVEMMSRQVALFSTSSRGLETHGLTISSGAREDVWQNSRVFRRSGGRSVPFLISQDRNNKIIGSADIDSVESLQKFLDSK